MQTLTHGIIRAICLFLFSFHSAVSAGPFVAFESGQVRPLALAADGNTLYAVNTPANLLDVFAVKADGLVHTHSIPVGLEPVAVAARTATEIWVVNHLSDSVSIVDMAAVPPRVVRTLWLADEPRDIVFAGPGKNRAFITTAHRGQNSPFNSSTNPGEFTTPGIGRADVWVFDGANPGAGAGGTPLTVITLFGDTPRALAVSPDGSTVYAGVFMSGNKTTVIHEQAVCNGGAGAVPCTVDGATAPGGLPAPNADAASAPQPEVGLIVRNDGSHWVDELNRQWDGLVRFNLPDLDVFAIDANANPPVQSDQFAGVGTVLYNMAVNPATGTLYVANTEAVNQVRFEGARAPGSTVSTVQGRQHETRITVIDPVAGTVTPRHLNKHIDYSMSPAPAGIKERSLALPRQLQVSSDGTLLYLAAKGSNKIGIFETAKLEDDSFVPDAADHVILTGGGPSGLVLDEARDRAYVLTRFDNGLSIVDTVTRAETHHYALQNPEPPNLIAGRPFLYDATLTSSNGEATCASCHVDGDLDHLAWDLGNPDDTILNNPLPFTLGPFNNPPSIYVDFHPLKGPMTTQTLRGMATHGSMHWRGDRTGGNDPGGDVLDPDAAFKKFNVAFEGLLGRSGPLSDAEMQAYTDFVLQLLPPPNPIRNLDDSLNAAQQAGRDFYMTQIVDTLTCNGCHELAPSQGFFGANGRASFEGETQHLKIPHLRNMYTKVGMFGMPAVSFFLPGDNAHAGDQIRGFGFMHDGAVDNLFRFFRASLFAFNNDTERRNMEQFMFAFDSDIKPVVGQQVSLTSTNKAAADPRVNLLVAQAAAGNADLVVKAAIGGQPRGWVRLAGGTFQSDKSAESPLSETQLRTLANTAGQELTFTAVPVGSGQRLGIDRDEDGVLDGDDVCPAVADAGQLDGDGDGVGDACDNCILKANADQRDSNGDGYGSVCDADLTNDGFVNFADLAAFRLAFGTGDEDADFNGSGFVNFADLAAFRQLFGSAPGPSALNP